MAGRPLHLAIVWHQHQPDYRDPFDGQPFLPWVRLHGTKDYADMAALLQEHPRLHTTVNLVPSLLEQVEDYAEGRASDPWLRLSRRPAESLETAERVFLLRNFFHGTPGTMVLPYPRFAELWGRRGADLSEGALERTAAGFSVEDWRDLQVWFNLTWTDVRWRREDPRIRGLVEKGRNFSEEEKRSLLDAQTDILRRIVPLYRELAASGRVEISTSPFFHPILPLLCDTDSAKEGMPGRPLPRVRFRAPEDALAQLRSARAFIERRFGAAPEGLWPSEGSVSPEAAECAARAGFRWMASDEEVLAASLGTAFPRDGDGRVVWPDILYRPYTVETASGPVRVVFRDHVLSDLVGFVYHRWQPSDAADDFLGRLWKVHQATKDAGPPALVCVILDGENAWEHYQDDGEPFLRALYGKICAADWLRSVSVGEFLREHPSWSALPRLFAGSWISHNFAVWIGHPEDHRAWEEVYAAREALLVRVRTQPEFASGSEGMEAYRCLYAAEGSDWTWWYGDEHHTPQKAEFDRLFRRYLTRLYELIGVEAPDSLQRPLYRDDARIVRLPYAVPVLDGNGAPTGWPAHEIFAGGSTGGAMHRGAGHIARILACADRTRLYVRVFPTASGFPERARLELRVVAPKAARVWIELTGDGKGEATVEHRAGDAASVWVGTGRDGAEAKVGTCVDLSLPLALLSPSSGEAMRVFFRVRSGLSIVERAPDDGLLELWMPETL